MEGHCCGNVYGRAAMMQACGSDTSHALELSKLAPPTFLPITRQHRGDDSALTGHCQIQKTPSSNRYGLGAVIVDTKGTDHLFSGHDDRLQNHGTGTRTLLCCCDQVDTVNSIDFVSVNGLSGSVETSLSSIPKLRRQFISWFHVVSKLV